MDTVPDGYVRHDRISRAIASWEPIYVRREGERIWLGLLIGEAHTNSRGLLHGGVIATLVDNAMGMNVTAQADVRHPDGTGPRPVTASLGIDYFGRADLGDWLEFDTTFVHLSGARGVASAIVSTPRAIVARANAAFAFPRRA